MTKFLQASDSEFTTLPELYAKYGLDIVWLTMWPFFVLQDGQTIQALGYADGYYDHLIENANLAIRYHWLVCRYLEEHPDAAHRYRGGECGWWYYDILDRAEQEYAQDLH